MAWLELTIGLQAQDPEPVETCLEGLGALAVTLTDAGDQPLLEPGVGETPLWQDVTLTALFETDADQTGIDTALRHVTSAELSWHALEDRQWEREWLTRFKPQQFGARLWIIPGDGPAIDNTAVNIRLDPGLAFGTGDHQTTAMCLRWLGDCDRLSGQQVLDFGCGSGILAIAALCLGADHALGVDIDPQALTATRDNAERNDVLDRLEIGMPDALTDQSFDLVIANILAAPLMELAPKISAHVAPGGTLLLSGILREQADAVMAAYTPIIAFGPVQTDGDWVRLDGKRVAH
ncbi:MAG: 50S ribosomal protein L11 methyltransferase [Gammaproteobacteria bacterium]